MISRHTVLILGAGASVPYGFPTGSGLRDLVCKAHEGASTLVKALIEVGYDEDDVASFVTQLRESGRLSVDAFLEHRADLVTIGKAALAAALIPFEHRDVLFDDLRSKGRWYAHLLDQLDAPPDKWADNRLTVLTYNYDRSLEFFLRTALAHSFGLDSPTAQRLADSLRVIHLHGSLGNLGEVHEGARPYSPEINASRIRLAADGIRIVSEANPSDPVFASAREALRAAERVYILGFGYGRVNLDRLGQECFPSGRSNYGSCYKMEEGERSEVEQWFGGHLSLRECQRQILDFLRYHQPLRAP